MFGTSEMHDEISILDLVDLEYNEREDSNHVLTERDIYEPSRTDNVSIGKS